MREIITSTLSAACLLLTLPCAKAQASEKAVVIKNFRTEITGENLDIRFDVKASGLDIKCGGQLILEFAVESADRRLVMPVVVYSGGERYRYERRRELLSDGYTIAPYAIYKAVGRQKTYETDYRLSIPYYAWMEHAGVTYREYTHDCSGDNQTGGGVLTADLNPVPVYVEPEVWKPDPALFAHLVGFLVPETEEIKSRASMLSLPIGFPVNVTEVRADFGDNRRELARADSLIAALDQKSDLIDIRGVHIRGYASPEGSYAANERLARGRSEGFKNYLIGKYSVNSFIRNASTSWVAEDWEGFGRMVARSDIAAKRDVLSIVNDPDIAPDTKDKMLQNIMWWSANYGVILREMYPKLRRIELRVDYTVQNLTDAQARELLHTAPEMLSQNEIYRVARFYEPGSKQYREVYEIAARQYPDDVIANNNAAAALLQEGRSEAALPYLEKIAGQPESLINYGAYWYAEGDLERALEYFTRAQEAGIEQGAHNIRLANPARNK